MLSTRQRAIFHCETYEVWRAHIQSDASQKVWRDLDSRLRKAYKRKGIEPPDFTLDTSRERYERVLGYLEDLEKKLREGMRRALD